VGTSQERRAVLAAFIFHVEEYNFFTRAGAGAVNNRVRGDVGFMELEVRGGF
jgi:hypothetical protein